MKQRDRCDSCNSRSNRILSEFGRSAGEMIHDACIAMENGASSEVILGVSHGQLHFESVHKVLRSALYSSHRVCR